MQQFRIEKFRNLHKALQIARKVRETYNSNDGTVELDVAEAAELGGLTDHGLRFREA